MVARDMPSVTVVANEAATGVGDQRTCRLVDVPHPLLTLLLDAADGRFRTADGGVTVLEPLPNGLECSVAFTGHAVIATALSSSSIKAWGADGFGGSLAPEFLVRMAGRDGEIGVLDATLAGRGIGGTPRLARREASDHPRVQHALALRDQVMVFGDERGLVTLSEGLAGRRELSIELDGEFGVGRGRALLADALTLVPEGEPVFAAVSPGNARSLRAFLAVGFMPIGSEVIVRPRR